MKSKHLAFSVRWKEPKHQTTADFTVAVDGEIIWPIEGAEGVCLEVQVDDLLSYLTEFWKPLLLRQTYPISVTPERPSLLAAEAEKRWQSQPGEVIEREELLVSAFEEAHDLSRCFAGLFDLPPLWLMRAGDRMLIETRSALRSVAFADARRSLSEVGDKIARHLDASCEGRWAELLGAWRGRDRGEPEVLLAWAAGLDREVASRFVSDETLSGPDTVTDAANDDDELRVAARMAGALPPAGSSWNYTFSP